MTSCFAVIPSIGGAPDLTEVLVCQLSDEGHQVLVIDNSTDSSGRAVMGSVAMYLSWPGAGLYQTWNLGVALGEMDGWDAVAVLNDDLVVDSGAVDVAVDVLLADPLLAAVGLDYFGDDFERREPLLRTTGTYRHGGIGGFAFVVKPQRWPEVDEEFEWWGGDDDLMFKFEQDGWGMGIALGARVHHASETTARQHPWTYEARERDWHRLVAKYPGRAW